MYFGTSGSDKRHVPFVILSRFMWENSGLMVFRSDSTRSGLIMRREAYPGEGINPTITNNGLICLYKTLWYTKSDIIGSGGIFVGADAFLTLEFESGERIFSISENQTIFLEAHSSHLRVYGLGTSPSTIKVRSFGMENLIEFYVGDAEAQHTYFPETGKLTFNVSDQSQIEFDIGKGYQPKWFQISKAGNFMNMRYTGSPGMYSHNISGYQCDSKFPQAPVSIFASSSSAIES
ncbi:hypothetical protein METBIDRAFT_101336 [Metschnikowia bicuspidata var. bicuspidata NRRL YB-4993]|uniref:Hyphally-regulated cell wall protein N-terminal domain-containing protein n=1 Tax=Metschnikowia bicuspidata var. bicuspidata NRRL YB-4993 TaxID=869754 RepID=A0A1A0HH11_9ASCO|nr:hypothetical protein METBIDRAFT_101336 [Metschnikowia bicuspidata var. bicuspidata NRRL YB-4993]OBA23167.1 hypothetical protein METBIDRAFT_101336 [Metschnikowia bicuspidata var. bicuspidata NRRL YB-4993]